MRTRMALERTALRGGFTLIELLVVVAVIALLISILLPALGKAREQGKAAVCKSNLHQLALSTTYYAQENADRLPYIVGDKNQGANAPFYQYHQIFMLWKYQKDLKLLVCPSARGDGSTQDSYPGNSKNALYTSGALSFYRTIRSDSFYVKAWKDGWWPHIDPTKVPPGWDMIPELNTEYWFNDWGFGATNPATGDRVPQISGGFLGKIPLPNYAVVLCDAVWQRKPPRHGRGNNFAFLDAHVSHIPRLQYLDDRREVPRVNRTDYDAFGNRPFYSWGLTRTGFDGAIDGSP